MAAAFSAKKYFTSQVAKLQSRIEAFEGGRLYLEVGGKFLFDGHASRVLPGFEPTCKPEIIREASNHLGENTLAILACVSAPDIDSGRVWNRGETYCESLIKELTAIEKVGMPRPLIVVNMVDGKVADGSETARTTSKLKDLGYEVSFRYKIDGYPNDVAKICSAEGFGCDDPIAVPESARLVCVIGLGSSSGKMSTCLGQVYRDLHDSGKVSGYAKYELFPIHDLPLEHPVNLAYEAATADIGDFNLVDPHHLEATGISSINYNRDVDAFPLLASLVKGVSPEDSPMRKYRSPTDMGVNCASSGIVDDLGCRHAGVDEVRSRMERHQSHVDDNDGDAELHEEAVRKCKVILEKAIAAEKN